MRAIAPILALAALLAAPLAIPPAKAFIELPSIQNRLIQLALDQISSPGSFEITVESIEDRDDLTTLVGVKVSDGESVWLTLEELSFAWRPTRLVAGELAITRLELIGLDVARLPSEDAEAPELEPQEPWQQSLFDWPRAPISVVVDGVRIERAHIAEGVLPQELRFDAEGSARDKGDIQEVALAVKRTDEVEGRIDFLMRRDFSEGTLRLDIGAREAPGGLVAAAAGFPADAPARLDLNADGTVAEWRLDFDAAVERVFEAEGQATIDYTDRLSAEADFTVTPGPELEPRLRTVLGEQARLRARVIEQADGMFEVVEGELSSPAVQMTATGAVATGPGESDLALSLVAQPVLAELVEGVAFERFSFDGRVTGPQGALVAVGEMGLRELSTPRADIGALALEGRVAQTSGGARFDLSGRGERMRIDRLRPELLGTAELAADGALDGDLLTLERAALDSPALTASASGSYDLAESTGNLTIDLATPEIAPLAATYDVTAEGGIEADAEVALAPERISAEFSAALTDFAMDRGAAGRLALSGTVTQEDERLSFDLEGSGERMRIDRLGPEVLGTARLAAAGTLDGDLLTLERAALDGPALTASARGRYDLAESTGNLTIDLATPEITSLAAAYDVTAEGSVEANAEVALAAERIEADFSAALTDFAMDRGAAGRLALAGTVTQAGERLAFDLEGSGERMQIDRLGPELLGTARLTAAGALDGDLLTLERAALDSPALTASARGSYDLADATGDLTLDLAAPEIAPLAAAYDVTAEGGVEADAEVALAPERISAEFSAALTGFAMDRGGAGRLALAGTVTQAGERLAFDLEGSGERLRIYRLGPEVLGTARLTAAGALDGDVLTLERAALDSPALTASARGRYHLADATGDLTFDLAAPEIAPLAAVYDVTAEGGVEAGAEIALAPQRVAAEFSAALTDFAMDRGAAGRLDLAGTVALDYADRLSAEADVTVTPGPGLEPRLRRVLGEQARLRARVIEQADGMIEVVEGELSSPAVQISATGALATGPGESDLAISLVAQPVLAELVEGVAFERFSFDGQVTGPQGGLVAVGELELRELTTPRADIGALALEGRVAQTAGGARFDFSGRGERMRIDRLGPELLGTAELAAAGALDGDVLTLERAALDSPALTVSARGSYDLAQSTGDLTLDLATPAIAPLAAAYDVTAEGSIEADAEVALAPERVEAEVSAALTGFVMDRGAAERLALAGTVTQAGERLAFDLEGSGKALELDQVPAELTREVRLVARGAMQAGTLELATARLESALLTAEASGTVGLEESTLAIDYSLETPDLAPVAAAYGVDAAGALEASGRAEGAFAAPRLIGAATVTGASFAGRSYGTVGLEHDVAVAPVPEGSLAITLRDSWLGDGRATTRFRLEGQQLSLAELEAEIFGATLAGSAEVDLAATLVDGAFDVSVRDLGGPGRFAGTEMTGAASGRVTLTAVEGRQDVRATLEATNLAAAGVRAARAELALAAADVLGTPRLDLEVTAGGVAAGAAELETLTATASGPLAALEFSAEAGGRLGDEDLTATLSGRANASGAGQRVTLAEAEVRLGDETMALAEPLELRLGGGTIAAEGLNLVLPGGGALGGDAALHPNGYSGDLALEGLMLEAAGRWLGLPFTAGTLDAEARFDTRPGNAGAELAARGRDVVLKGADLEEVAGRSVAVDLDAGWDGQRLDARAEISGGFGNPFRASLGLPLRPRAGALPTVPEDGALDGRLAWSGRIGDLWALVPAPGHLLDGQADIDLALAGTPAAPQVSGRAEVSAGQYQNLDAGTILTDLTIRTSVSGDRRVGLTLEARDGADGRVRSEATVRLAEQPPTLELTATAERAVLVRRDDVTAAMSGEVALDGPLNALALTGRLTVDKAEVRLVNAMPPGVVTLDGIRIKGEPEPEETGAGRSPIRLDLAIEAERDIFVRGRGLDSEWRMALQIGGDALSPVVTGSVERVRGQFSLIGRAFELERGRVSFDGGREVDPELDIYLQHEDHGIRGGIVVSGRASAPELGFASTPALPEDEVLPRLLFGQSSQSLTGGQALQLAAGLAALMGGGGGGPIAALRQAAGLDVLRLEGESVEDAGVTVGRNVGENVFIGARQGLGGQGSSVTVEVEVFQGVTVDTELDQTGGSNIGITLKKDF